MRPGKSHSQHENDKWGGYLLQVKNWVEEEKKKNRNIDHGFIIAEKPEAVRLANYLRARKYKIEVRWHLKILGQDSWLVAIPFKKEKKSK